MNILCVLLLKCVIVFSPVAALVLTILHTSTVLTFFPTLPVLIISLPTAGVVFSRKTTGSLKPSPLIIHLLVFFLIALETSTGFTFFSIFLSLFSSFVLMVLNFFFPPCHLRLSRRFHSSWISRFHCLASALSCFLVSAAATLSCHFSSLFRISWNLRSSLSRVAFIAFSRFSCSCFLRRWNFSRSCCRHCSSRCMRCWIFSSCGAIFLFCSAIILQNFL